MQILFTVLFIVITGSLIIGSVLLIKLLLLILKRAAFIVKLRRFCSANYVPCTVHSAMRSLFKRGEEPDVTVEKGGETVEIFIFSNMFRHSRYHFLDNGDVEIYHIGRGVIPFLGRGHLRTFAAHPEGITRLGETRIMTAKGFKPRRSPCTQIMLVHPIPLKITRILGNGPRDVYDGEPLFGALTLYSGNGMRKFLLRSDKKPK